MAPELGGLRLQETIYGIDASTREVVSGGRLWLMLMRRLSGWRWIGYMLSIPGLSVISQSIFNRQNTKHCKGKAEWR